MLNGFVVPHAHFRIFYGDRAPASRRSTSHDQFPLICAPARAESAPTDLHLREFAQLEAQVKAVVAAQQQQPGAAGNASASVNARTLSDMSAGTLAECFAFYTRLMTAESFTWPDFLATVFTKLAEHFANSDDVNVSSADESVRSSVLAVFQQSRAHVAQVNDPLKLIAHVLPVLTTSTNARACTLTLQLLETMPDLIQNDAVVHAQLVSRLYANDSAERAAAIAATRAVLPLVSELQNTVFKLIIGSANRKNTAVLALLEHAVASSIVDAEKAYDHCGVLYHDLVDDRSAIHCLRAMTSLAVLHQKHLLAPHLQLIQHVIRKDPRKIVHNFALLSVQDLIVASPANPDAFVGLLKCVLDQIRNEKGYLRIKHSSLVVLEQWSREHALDDDFCDQVVKQAEKMYQIKPDRFGGVSAKILANVVRQALNESDETGSTSVQLAGRALSTMKLLFALLHPSRFSQSSTAWVRTLACLEALCIEFPGILAAHVVSCSIELIRLANEVKMPELKKHIFTALSHIAGSSVEGMAERTQVLLRELSSLSAGESSNKSRAALAVTLFRVLRGSSSSKADVNELEQILTNASYPTQADRYDVAKLAMTHGYFRLALDLTSSVAAATDKECFGGWLQALKALSDAEASVLLESRVGLNSIYQLSRTTTYLKAATTSRYGFELQLQVVELRTKWSQLVLQAQQFAGEAEYSNTKGAVREKVLRDRFQDVASHYRSLRLTLLGASAADLDALDGHARVSELLAMAIDGFLLLLPVASSSSLAHGVRIQSWSKASPMWEMCEALETEICEKSEILQRIDASRRAALGGKVMVQLLKTVCSIPFALPQQFFRLTIKSPQRRIASNAQFLTSAENSAFTSKPRPRSQLGVPFGTDFNSLLKGVLEVDSGSKNFWEKTVSSIEIEVVVRLVDKTAAVATSGSSIEGSDANKNVYDRIRGQIQVDWSKAVRQSATDSATSSSPSLLYLPFETPVHVKAESLCVKGSFHLLANMAAIDRDGGKWPLASTGCTRGFIVY